MINYNKAPVSNRERQRQFRARHPGYFGRCKAKQRAQMQSVAVAASEQLEVTQTQMLALPAPLDTISQSSTQRVVLMLPAPGFNPILPSLNNLATHVDIVSGAKQQAA